METPIYVLLSQQDALQRQMEVVANNMANMNTTGYKSRAVMFEDFIRRPSPKSEQHMVLDRGTLRDISQGTLLKTDNPLDIAISGQGYFAIQTPQGTQYTRQGSFHLDTEGNMVTFDGYKVLSGGGQPITIPAEANQISIGRDGLISTDVGDAGRLQVVRFENESQMQETHGGLYQTDEVAQTDDQSVLNQGMVEGSNVKPIAEVSQVMEVSRTYQRVARMIDAENERLRNAIRTLGKVT